MPNLAEQITHFFDLIGSLVCHQNPEKTMQIGRRALPVCARCTGGYLGLLVGYLVLILWRKRENKGPPDLWTTLVLSTPVIADVVTQTLGVRESTNALRLLTGLLFGLTTLPFLVYAIQLLPTLRRLPILSHISPKEVRIDDVDKPWITSKALIFGAVICLVMFFALEHLANSSLDYFYWVVALPLIFSIIFHVFLLVPLILCVLVYRFWRFTARKK